MENCNKSKCVIISFLIVCLFCGCSSGDNKKENSENQKKEEADYILNNSLSSKDYSTNHSITPKDGFIPTAKEAVQVAKIVLSTVYGKERIEKQEPFSVNLENGVWIIEGYLAQGMDGGVAYMEIRKDNGEILKVIHTK